MINKLLISEAISNIKARQFVLSGQLSQEDFDKIKKGYRTNIFAPD